MSICAAVSVKKISSLWLVDANWKTTPIIWVVFERGDVVRGVVLVLRRLHLAFLDSEQQGVRRVVAVMPSFLFRSFWSRIIMSWTIVFYPLMCESCCIFKLTEVLFKKIQFLLITGWERMSERRSGTLTLLNCIFSEASYTIVFLLAFFCKHKCHNLLFSGSPRWKRREGNKYCSWICCCRRCTYHVFSKVQLFGLAANYRSTICMPLHKTLLSRYLD